MCTMYIPLGYRTGTTYMVNSDNLLCCTFYLAEAPIHNHEHCVQVQYSQSDIIMDDMNFVNSYCVAVVNNV